MPEYRFLFDPMYVRDEHPLASKADSKGWLTVVAPDEQTAKTTADTVLNAGEWLRILRPGTGTDAEWRHVYPHGEVARIGESA